jgi:Protein of unknown function (DUF1329)
MLGATRRQGKPGDIEAEMRFVCVRTCCTPDRVWFRSQSYQGNTAVFATTRRAGRIGVRKPVFYGVENRKLLKDITTLGRLVMKSRICVLALAVIMAAATSSLAQTFDINVYNQMVDANSAETIPPGTKITVDNWAKYKNFFPYFIQLGYAQKMHFHVINRADYTVEVVPTEDFPPPKAMRENTEKYAGQTKLVPYAPTGGFTWTGYQAGTPFPNPTEPNRAAKIMYNTWAGFYTPFVLHEWSHNWETDSFGNVLPEDTDDSFFRLMHLSDPPYPMNLPDADDNIYANRFIQLTPEQAKYTTALELYPDDPVKLTNEYVFLPSLRRSLRLSTSSRCAPILGTDYLADDTDWKPAFFKPQYIGEKKLLVPYIDEKVAYTEDSRLSFAGGDYKTGIAFPGWPNPEHVKWQLRKVYLINLVPSEALGHGYCYTDRIFYVDAQLWSQPYLENYDRSHKIYHMTWLMQGPVMYQGQRTIQPRSFGFSMAMDLQNNHASPDIGYNLAVDEEVPPQYRAKGIYTPGGLASVMR